MISSIKYSWCMVGSRNPNLWFNMHEAWLHYYNPTDKAVVLIKNVSGNNKGFSKRQINGEEQVKTLYTELGYSSIKYVRCIDRSHKILDCPVQVQSIYILHAIWGKNIASLKGNNTRNKPIHVVGYIGKIQKEIVNIHKEVFMKADISFLNGIPFCLFVVAI